MSTRPLPSVLFGLTLLAGGLCLSPQAADSQAEDLFPTPTAGMVVPGRGEGEPSLEALVREFGAVTGLELSWDEYTAEGLKARRPGLDRALEVPAGEVYPVIETILRQHRFALVSRSREEPRKLAVIDLVGQGPEDLDSDAAPVPVERLPEYADHPAIKITTRVTLEHLEEKTLGSTFEALVANPRTLKIDPDLKTKQLTLTGFGPALADLVRILQDLDESARRLAEDR